MNVNIKTLYILLKGGRVQLCESNLKDFIAQFPKEIAGIRAYDYYYRKFNDSDFFQFEFNKEYFFQKIEYHQGMALEEKDSKQG